MSVDRSNLAEVTRHAFGGPMDFDQLSDDELLAAIALDSSRAAASDAGARHARVSRLEKFAAGRARRPPIKFRLLAEAAGVTDAAVITSLKNATTPPG